MRVVEALGGGTGNAVAGGENTLDELETLLVETFRESGSLLERGGGIGSAALGGGDKSPLEGGLGSGDFGGPEAGASGNLEEGGCDSEL